jgi:hypothetical protein
VNAAEWERASRELRADRPGEAYYLLGYCRGEFSPGPALERFHAANAELLAGRLRPGFAWHEKYPNTRDLPDAYDYDSALLDVLFESRIQELLPLVTGRDLMLAHVQVRLALPGPSYHAWHRDTHLHAADRAGNLPPVQKLIVYPTGGRAPEPRLHIAPGTHLSMIHEGHADMAQLEHAVVDTVSSSDSGYLIFDTSTLHGVIPESHADGSIRIIYSFCAEHQLHNFLDSRPLQERFAARRLAA